MKTKPWTRNGTTGFINDSGERVCTGSKMGRRDCIPDDFNTVRKLRLARVPMVAQCYDAGGAYWGMGAPLYCAWGDSDTEQAEVYFRARDRADAKRQALAAFPNATFYR